MNRLGLSLLFLLISLFITACTSAPKFDTRQVDRSLTPKSVNADIENTRGKVALWGGVILATKNLKATSQIEVLAYPLDSNSMPLREREPLGRFLIQHSGFLEPATYAQGRMVTVIGKITGTSASKVGEMDYVYPVIKSTQHHLWSKDSGDTKTRLHFGIGIRL